MTPARVLGIGSPFGADRLGWDVVDALARRDDWPPGRVVFACCARPGGELLAALERPGLLFLVDAMRSGTTPGTVRCLRPAEILRDSALISGHGFGINSALSLADALGTLTAEVRVCGIEIPPECTPDGGFPASPGGGRVDDKIIREIRKILMDSLPAHGAL